MNVKIRFFKREFVSSVNVESKLLFKTQRNSTNPKPKFIDFFRSLRSQNLRSQSLDDGERQKGQKTPAEALIS